MGDPAPAPRAERRRVLLVAGEASGDVHAADFVAALARLLPGVRVRGIGGAEARAQGMETAIDVSEVNAMGLTEVGGKLRSILRAWRWVGRELATDPPDLVVLVDFPEFNLAVARRARRRGVPVFYYVSPQVWAWRRGRVRKILRRVDRLAVVFPFEPAVYGDSPKVVFVGHPLLDRVRVTGAREEVLARHGLDPRRRLVTLLPGSRRKELQAILPEMAGAAGLLARPDLQFALALAPTSPRPLAEEILRERGVSMPVVEGDTYNLMAASDLLLATSGTVTLEAALLGRPMVLMYRVSSLTFAVARRVVDVPAIGMPNLIAGRKIVPELVQEEAVAARIAAEARAILDDPERLARMSGDLAAVRAALGEGGAAERAARLAAELVRGSDR
jgi:lipid-A-disaccharide synthase